MTANRPVRKQTYATDTIRQRVISARRFGTLPPDGRLPSARVLAVELATDPRVVAAAYRRLEREGLVERRPPSRAFFAVGTSHAEGARAAILPSAPGIASPAEPRPVEWLADVLADGLERDIRAPAFPEHAWRAVDTLRLRAACIESNDDHVTWLRRELREDYGIGTAGVELETAAAALATLQGRDDEPDAPRGLPPELRRADLLVTTAEHRAVVESLAGRLGRACVVVSQRPDLTRELEWLLERGPVYFVGTDPRFAARVRAFYHERAYAEHVRPIILGVDDPGEIPRGAPAYVMRTARDRLGGVPPHVRSLSTLRAFSRETRVALLRLVVQRNLAAWASQQTFTPTPGASQQTSRHP